LKPHLPTIGRFLIVVTFLEDALRILTQWGDQIWYLQKYVAPPMFTLALTQGFNQPSTLSLGPLSPLPFNQRCCKLRVL
jgi:hypothetical protein